MIPREPRSCLFDTNDHVIMVYWNFRLAHSSLKSLVRVQLLRLEVSVRVPCDPAADMFHPTRGFFILAYTK
jgi:hypothetical protein